MITDTKISQMLEFFSVLEELKKIERFKDQVFWKDYPFPDRYESVADHTWRMAMMLIVVERELHTPIDLPKALKMALIHDIPEIITGDRSPLGSDGTGNDSHAYNQQAAATKHEAETKAAREIFNRLDGEVGEELYSLWLEYENQETYEAKVVRAIDKIEGKLQAMEYSDGRVDPKHMEFNVKYGVETYAVDPAIEKLGLAAVAEFKRRFADHTASK